jgi:hypothetical protein
MLAFWIVSVLIIIFGSLRRSGERRREDFITALGYVAFSAIAASLQALIIRLCPHTIDLELMRIDRMMGFNVAHFAAHFADHRIVLLLLAIAYLMLPVVMTTAWTIEQGIMLRRTILIGGLFCFIVYYAFPAVGLAWFDWSAPSSIPISPRNCLPSMHFSWSLMIAWNVQSRWLRVGLWFYAALIAVATLALGEHYLIDLIVAVPYTVAVQWVALAWDRRGFNVKTESEFIALSSSDRA